MVSLRCSSVAVAMVSLIACHTTQAEGDDGAARAQTIAGGRGFPAERDLAILLPRERDARVKADDRLASGHLLLPERWVNAVAEAYEPTNVGSGFAEESWYEDWRLVSVRISPCAPIAASPVLAPESVCWPIVRLVWQPVVNYMDRGGVQIDAWADDRAIHALYPVYNRDDGGARVSSDALRTVRSTLARGGTAEDVSGAVWAQLEADRSSTVAWLLEEVAALRDGNLQADSWRELDYRPELAGPEEAKDAFVERLMGLLSETAHPAALRELTSFSLPAGRQPSGDDSWVFVQFEGKDGEIHQRSLEVYSLESGELLLDYGLDQDAGQTRESERVTEALRRDPNGELHTTVVESSEDIDRIADFVADPSAVFVPNTTCATCHRLNDLRFNFHSLSFFEDEDHTISPRVRNDVARDLEWVQAWRSASGLGAAAY